ncbi:MAG: phosphotransferase family protein [Mycobacterium sp.]
MQTWSGAEIHVDGDGKDTVYKLHRPGTDPRQLATRLRIAAASQALLSPRSVQPERAGDRWRSIWPYVETVVPQPEYLPWAEAGGLLARLHREEPAGRIPSHGWPQRLRRAMDALREQPDATVRRAAAALPDAVWRAGSPDRPATVVHGDFHLGQLGRSDAGAPWLLIDVDDLGVGDPAWDLARPAGFWAAGLIPDDDWTAFVDAYRDADGPALPGGDPWTVLEPFARAAVVQAAAHHRDDELLLAACARMAS